MLLSHEPGSQAEIRDVLHTDPPAWLVILNVETIPRTGILQARVAQHEAALIAAANIQTSLSVTVKSLPALLRSMGISTSNPSAPRPFRRYRSPTTPSATAHVAAICQGSADAPDTNEEDSVSDPFYEATGLDIEAL